MMIGAADHFVGVAVCDVVDDDNGAMLPQMKIGDIVVDGVGDVVVHGDRC